MPKCTAIVSFTGIAVHCSLPDGDHQEHRGVVNKARSSFWPNGLNHEQPTTVTVKWRDEKRCPDGGVCHHKCQGGCFRVMAAGPLSGVYRNDKWPAIVIDHSGDPEGYVL